MSEEYRICNFTKNKCEHMNCETGHFLCNFGFTVNNVDDVSDADEISMTYKNGDSYTDVNLIRKYISFNDSASMDMLNIHFSKDITKMILVYVASQILFVADLQNTWITCYKNISDIINIHKKKNSYMM